MAVVLLLLLFAGALETSKQWPVDTLAVVVGDDDEMNSL